MTTLGPELLERLDTELAAAAVARGQVTVTGDWTSRTRRTYQAAEQLGSGTGPYVEADRNFDHPSECLLATEVVPLGRVSCVARAGGNAFSVVLFAADSVKFGRNRLWRLRDPIADHLAPDLRELLTRRRAGSTPGF